MKYYRYTIDAPYAVINLIIVGMLLLAIGFAADKYTDKLIIPVFIIGAGWSLIYTAVMMLFSSIVLKKKFARKLVRSLNLQGDERILDVGCGNGLYLSQLLNCIKTGKVVGVDMWVKKDQLGNSPKTTIECISTMPNPQEAALVTGDMLSLPFKDNQFDITVSSLAIHNLATQSAREKAVMEIARVTKPKGRIVLIDYRHGNAYRCMLEKLSLDSPSSRLIKGVFPPVRLVEAVKAIN